MQEKNKHSLANVRGVNDRPPPNNCSSQDSNRESYDSKLSPLPHYAKATLH